MKPALNADGLLDDHFNWVIAPEYSQNLGKIYKNTVARSQKSGKSLYDFKAKKYLLTPSNYSTFFGNDYYFAAANCNSGYLADTGYATLYKYRFFNNDIVGLDLIEKKKFSVSHLGIDWLLLPIYPHGNLCETAAYEHFKKIAGNDFFGF